jgi:Raf kinase inhibitor-like YbhB/YbcL family protein
MKLARWCLFALILLAVACQPSPAATPLPATIASTGSPAADTPLPASASGFTLNSPSLADEGDMPLLYVQAPFKVVVKNSVFVCPGAPAGKKNISPALTWSHVPPSARSLVLIMLDDMHFAHPDLPEGTTFAHWMVFNMPPTVTSLPEGAASRTNPVEGALQGANAYPSPYNRGYGGPCPPVGERHLYIFTLYALDTTLKLEAGALYDAVMAAMKGHVVAQAELRTYYTGR